MFHRRGKNNPKIYMKQQKSLNAPSNHDEKKKLEV